MTPTAQTEVPHETRTTRRSSGEFTPPRELAILSAARVAGRGTIEVSGAGLVVQGRILGAASPVPSWALLAVLGAGLLIDYLVPHSAQILTVATIAVVGIVLWFRYRAEFGLDGAFTVPWADVEHVVRLPSSPGVVAVVLSRPLAGAGTPEQVFFTPTEGLDLFLGALRRAAPPHLTWDLESADRPPDPDLDNLADD